jgi:flagellar biosynthesis component FlhA
LGRQDVQTLIDHLKESNPALVAELLPDLVSLGIIQRVLQNLLRENLSILNLPLILECIGDFASVTKNPDDLSELTRRRLGLYFVPELESRPGIVRAVTLDPRLEQALIGRIHRTPTEVGLGLDPALGRHLLQEMNLRIADFTRSGLTPVLVVGTELRLPLRRFLEPSFWRSRNYPWPLRSRTWVSSRLRSSLPRAPKSARLRQPDLFRAGKVKGQANRQRADKMPDEALTYPAKRDVARHFVPI